MARSGLGERVALRDEVRELAALGGERRERTIRFDRQMRQYVVLAGEDCEHRFQFLQGGVGAADDRVQVLAATGERSAELVEDDRQTLTLGQTVDVAEQVWVDRAVGFRDGQQPLPRAFLPRGDLFQRRRQRRAFDTRLGGQAVDELLADQRLRTDRATRIGAKVLE